MVSSVIWKYREHEILADEVELYMLDEFGDHIVDCRKERMVLGLYSLVELLPYTQLRAWMRAN